MRRHRFLKEECKSHKAMAREVRGETDFRLVCYMELEEEVLNHPRRSPNKVVEKSKFSSEWRTATLPARHTPPVTISVHVNSFAANTLPEHDSLLSAPIELLTTEVYFCFL